MILAKATTGIFDAKGKTLQFDGETIYSNLTITNAIIEANPYIQIFDLTVTLVNCKAREFSSAWYGAKPTLADNSAILQKGIDTCLANMIPNFYLAGSYKIATGLRIYSIYKDLYVGANLHIYGDGDMWSDRTTLTYSGESFAIGYQMAKGGSLSRVKILGNYVAPVNNSTAYYTTAFIPKYGHYGIAIDYDGSKNTGGTTALHVHDVWVEGFDTLYSVSPNAVTFNADSLVFTNIRCGSGRIGFQSNQAQEKGNQINNIVSWGNLHTLIQIGQSGKFQAGQYTIRGGNVAGGCVQLFDISLSGWNGFSADGLAVESLGRIGTILAKTSVCSTVWTISNFTIRFALKQYAGEQTLFSSNSAKVLIQNSNLWYYGQPGVMKYSGSFTMNNVDLGSSTFVNTSVIIK